MEKFKYIKYLAGVIGIVMTIWGTVTIIQHNLNSEDQLKIYSSHQVQELPIEFGVNEVYSSKNKRIKWTSINYENLSSNHDYTYIQILETPTDNIKNKLEIIGEKYKECKTILVSLKLDKDINKKELKEIYKQVELIQGKYTNIEVLIPLDKAVQVYKDIPIKYAYIDIKQKEDMDLLEELSIHFKQEVEIIVNDYILEEQEELSEQLDLMSQLYYSTIMKLPNITVVFQQGNVNTAHYRIIEFYNEILSNKEYRHEPLENKDNISIVISDEANKVSFMPEYDENIEQIDYKLNEETILKTYRYPFKLMADEYELVDGVNRLKIIIKYRDKEDVIVQTYYLKNKRNKSIGERQRRVSKNYKVEEKSSYDNLYIPVLMYHEFKDEVGESDSEQSISVGTQLFKEQLIALKNAGYTTINFKDLKDYLEGVGGLPQKPIILTTDDGYLSNYTIAYPILKELDMQATYFITPKYVGIDTMMPHFTWDQAKEMEASGLIDIQSHTYSHNLLDQLPYGEVIYEASLSFEKIEENLGKRDVKVLAYPQFQHNYKTKRWIESIGVNLQVTNLVKYKGSTEIQDIKRIHVANTTTPEELLKEIENLTMK
ncbi:polysaccharide deacetylase family protein [Niameybacter massiliensis]|uniref:polysaccharide deacetylase family protein n=1 Tax=Niameybacter massiliensis TaxID=1658108 RepID=UPI0006B40EA3|nr:polysaccharide deacetylase family protein [Niameybacter massiliensis]